MYKLVESRWESKCKNLPRGQNTAEKRYTGEEHRGEERNGSHQLIETAKKAAPVVTFCPALTRKGNGELGKMAPVPILLASGCVTDQQS